MRAPLTSCALLVAIAAAWWPLFANDFVNYDDPIYVSQRPEVRAGISREGVAWAFGSFHGANWFPLTRLSWMLDAELFGIEPRAFHATSLALHAGATLLLLAALAAMTGAFWRSALVAGVFALHPLHVESVAWVSARKDVLAGFFTLLALWAWVAYARGRRPRLAYAACAAGFGLALLAKQVIVAFPLVLLLFDRWPLGRLGTGPGAIGLRRAVLEKLPLLALALVAGVLAALAQARWGTIQDLEHASVGARLANAALASAAYLADSLWPSGLAVFYPYPQSIDATGAGLAALLLLGISALAWWQRHRRPWIAVGWLFAALTLLPVIGLVQLGQAARADRYMYLPLIGVALPVAWALGELAERGRAARRACAGLAVACLVALGAATHAQLGHWQSSVTLFEHALRVTERNHVAHLNLGLALMNAGRLDEADPHLVRALRLAPHALMARGILGELRLRQGRWPEAADHFRRALALGNVEKARWRAGLGRALHELGDGEAALEVYRAALRDRPHVAALHAEQGVVLAGLGREREAIDSYREALRLDPGLAAVRTRLASLLNDRAWQLATSGDPGAASADEAVALAEEAAQVSRRRVPEILDTLSVAHAAAGRHAEARAAAEEALAVAEATGRTGLAASIRRRLAPR